MILYALASGAAVVWIAFDAHIRVEPSSATAARNAPDAGRAAIGGSLPARAAFGDAGADPFSPRTPEVALPPASRHAGPGAVAPALPYRFVGRVYQGGGTQIFIARGDRVIAVKKGDVLDGEYRVDAVSGTELAFIHLASGSRQLLQFTPPIEDENRIAGTAAGATAREAVAPLPAPSRPALPEWKDTLTLERRAHPAARLE